ncbi:antibiotic biosynthesis monooxygenase domain protein [Luminiphilus syltensis NOR5-1B]|uniref:Antibiotic biosynthesis monooxygenase domain protein n=1 Tax=Luminiphilus syltensis NOR5-1B TaxID=565045 RepID=B8KSN9_9GAMM|nr:putative quinol monooxygenase [Luminiphilus syltensis]EED36236.1 antibiotic biosynthesis monooxygenase domain protein [Luminiphilus syltensis NOR5-1B]
MNTLAIIARTELSAEDAPKYVEAARKLIEPTRKEAGCEMYAMAVDICDPNVIWISEQWASKQHLDDHLRAPHILEFLQTVGGLDIKSLDARQYSVSAMGPVEMPE